MYSHSILTLCLKRKDAAPGLARRRVGLIHGVFYRTSDAKLSATSRPHRQQGSAKEAAAAREGLQRVLAVAAEALQQVAVVMAESSSALAKATAREDAAMTAYITSLEAAISRQREFS